MSILLFLTTIYIANASPLICQYGGYCRSDSDCVAGNKCNIQNQYYSQCIPNPASYKTSNCVQNFQRCGTTSICCDPGSSCSSNICVQPNSGSCVKPAGYSDSPKPTASPITRVYKSVIDDKNRVTEIHELTYANGKLTKTGGEYYFYDDITEIGYFEGEIIPGTNKALVNYGGIKPTGAAFQQLWAPYIGELIYEYRFDSNNNVLGYTYIEKSNNNWFPAGLSAPVEVTFCTKSFKECTGEDEKWVLGDKYMNIPHGPPNPLDLQNSVFTQIGDDHNAAPGRNPVSFHWTGVGPTVGGALVGGYEFINPEDAVLETGYYHPSSIAVNAKDYLVVLSDFKTLTGNFAGTHFGSITYFVNNYFFYIACSGTYDSAGKLVLTDKSTCVDGTYLASKNPAQAEVKRLLNYIPKSAFADVFNIWA